MAEPRGGSGSRGRSSGSSTSKRLSAAGVEAVALAIVINSGVTLVKTIPLRRFEEAVRFGIGLSPVFGHFLVCHAGLGHASVGVTAVPRRSVQLL